MTTELHVSPRWPLNGKTRKETGALRRSLSIPRIDMMPEPPLSPHTPTKSMVKRKITAEPPLTPPARRSSSSRIPETLQAVLIMSNRGQEITIPPPKGVAAKNFGIFRSRSFKKKKRKSSVASMSSFVPVEPVAKHISPQAYVTSVCKSRGYCTTKVQSLACSYHNDPSEFQKASHGNMMVQAIRENDIETLRELLDLGLSPNACNNYGESVVHLVCRLGRKSCLRVLLEFECDVRVSDDFGRTPLHDACWSEDVSLDIVEMLLDQDPFLLYIADGRNSLPLDYAPESKWTMWTKFFMAVKDKFWPERDVSKIGFTKEPPRAMQPRNSRPVLNPKNGISLEKVAMIADGTMDLSEAYENLESGLEDNIWDESSFDSYEPEQMLYGNGLGDLCAPDFDDDTDASMDDAASHCTFCEDEMAEILGSIVSRRPVEWSSLERSSRSLDVSGL